MLCENIFCIYWEKHHCCLEEISLDVRGSCNECIYINVDEDKLKEHRQAILKNINK